MSILERKQANIFIGINVHTTTYTISFYNPETGETNYEKEMKADNASVLAYIKHIIKRHFSDGSYEFLVGYEAGYTGYGLYRFLTSHNINCVVIAPNTIKRSGKQKKIKNNVAGARLIAHTLASNDYSAVAVPDEEEESIIHLLKYRDSIKRSITQTKNQLLALLSQKGFKSEHAKWTQPWLNELTEFIKQEKQPNDKYVMEELMEYINHQTDELDNTEAFLAETAKEEK